MTTNTNDFWYRAVHYAHEKEAKDHYSQLAPVASKYSYSFHVLIFQSSDDPSYCIVAAGNFPPRARKEVQQCVKGSSITLSSRDFALVRKRIAEQHQRFDRAISAQGKATQTFEESIERERLHLDKPGVAPTHSSAQADQNFYEKKERLLRRVQAGTATQAQKDWLKRWGVLEQPEPQPPNPTYPGSPTKINPVYRYRGPMKATPVAKLEGPEGPGTHRNRNGKLVVSKKGHGSKRRSVFVKYQSMR